MGELVEVGCEHRLEDRVDQVLLGAVLRRVELEHFGKRSRCRVHRQDVVAADEYVDLDRLALDEAAEQEDDVVGVDVELARPTDPRVEVEQRPEGVVRYLERLLELLVGVAAGVDIGPEEMPVGAQRCRTPTLEPAENVGHLGEAKAQRGRLT